MDIVCNPTLGRVIEHGGKSRSDFKIYILPQKKEKEKQREH
jgi:hypothetical protein